MDNKITFNDEIVQVMVNGFSSDNSSDQTVSSTSTALKEKDGQRTTLTSNQKRRLELVGYEMFSGEYAKKYLDEIDSDIEKTVLKSKNKIVRDALKDILRLRKAGFYRSKNAKILRKTFNLRKFLFKVWTLGRQIYKIYQDIKAFADFKKKINLTSTDLLSDDEKRKKIVHEAIITGLKVFTRGFVAYFQTKLIPPILTVTDKIAHILGKFLEKVLKKSLKKLFKNQLRRLSIIAAQLLAPTGVTQVTGTVSAAFNAIWTAGEIGYLSYEISKGAEKARKGIASALRSSSSYIRSHTGEQTEKIRNLGFGEFFSFVEEQKNSKLESLLYNKEGKNGRFSNFGQWLLEYREFQDVFFSLFDRVYEEFSVEKIFDSIYKDLKITSFNVNVERHINQQTAKSYEIQLQTFFSKNDSNLEEAVHDEESREMPNLKSNTGELREGNASIGQFTNTAVTQDQGGSLESLINSEKRSILIKQGENDVLIDINDESSAENLKSLKRFVASLEYETMLQELKMNSLETYAASIKALADKAIKLLTSDAS